MTTVLDARYRINGLIDTAQPVLANLEKLCNASGCWLTYDTHAGKFAVVINKAGTSLYSFDDSNIIGSISVSTTGIDKLYNSVKVVYPHEDLKGETDFIQITIPAIDRFENEFDNVLNLNYGIVTNPVQAELLSFIELKQNRVDKIVRFTTDYSKIGVKAGDLIDVTNTVYGFVSKMFRVITVSEADGDNGSIVINITALEYDETVYDEDMSRYARSDNNGITPLASLPQPTKPTIVKYEVVASPHVDITTTLTGGLVEHVEFWTSTDGGSVYTLLKTADPTTSSNVFPLNSNITITDSTVASGPLIVKCRSTNADGVSLFSTPSDSITFTPKQVPAAITDSTTVTNNDGTSISGMLTTAALLKLINDYFKVGGTGIAAGGHIKAGQADATAITPVLTGTQPDAYGLLTKINEFTFVPPRTGLYKVRMFLRYGALGTASSQSDKFAEFAIYTGAYYSGALGGPTDLISDTLTTVNASAVDYELNTDWTGDQYTEQNLERIITLTGGTTYYFNSFHCVGNAVEYLAYKLCEVIYTGMTS